MKNLNRKSDFDRHWKDVFSETEITPSENVWERIDSTLSKEEAGYHKKRAFLFKMLAAASIAFAIGISTFSLYYSMNDQTSDQLISEETNSSAATENAENQNFVPDIETQSDRAELVDNENEQVESDNTNKVAQGIGSAGSDQTYENQGQIVAAVGGHDSDEEDLSLNQNEDVIQHTDPEQQPMLAMAYGSHEAGMPELGGKGIEWYSKEEYITLDHIYLIPVVPRDAFKNKNKQEDPGLLVAGLDFSAGQFDPNFQSSGSLAYSNNSYVMADTRNENVSAFAANKDFLVAQGKAQKDVPEIAYSYGANVGFRVTRRFLVQTGIAYRKANTTITTSAYFDNPGTNSRIPIIATFNPSNDGLSAVKGIEETDLRNQYEFASVPVRAGYILLDKKFNITLLAGISSEFFINSTISDSNDNLNTISAKDDSNAPFRKVYFNGSLGTMFGYSFAPNYLLSVEPSYRMAVNSFTKDDFYLESRPSSIMVSFGVSYNFK